MKHIKITSFVIVISLLSACTPQATTLAVTSSPPPPTQASLVAISTSTLTALPTETLLPTSTSSPIPPSCATPLNPIDHATVPARGPFDFIWTAFSGATSYVISIQPKNWYPTNFPVNGTILTRYMETFSNGPSFEWSITALDNAGREICKAGPYAFTTSVEVSATASFDTSVIAASGSDSSNTSSNSGQNTSNGGSNDESNNGSSNDSNPDIASIVISDSDTSDCRLYASFRVKSNRTFTILKLIYGYNGKEDSVDLTLRSSLDPYPAYNYYDATTPPLPVKQGDIVAFGIWYKTNTGDELNGLALYHTMSNCSP